MVQDVTLDYAIEFENKPTVLKLANPFIDLIADLETNEKKN